MSKRDSDLVQQASEHVFQLFRKAGSENHLVFHGFKRSRDVVRAVREIGKAMDLPEADFEGVLLAAWFYHSGHALAHDPEGKRSLEIAREFLAGHGAKEGQIAGVLACLTAVRLKEHGTTPDDVLRDGLLLWLARQSHLEDAELLRLEIERRENKVFSDVEWTQQCIDFFDQNPFRTRYAQIEYDADRAANLVRLHRRLRKNRDEVEEQRQEETKSSRGMGKVIQDIYSIQLRALIRLFAIADRRTSTMIRVNALMIGIIVALLGKRIAEERTFLWPTIALLAMNLVVIFQSVFSMSGTLARVPAAEGEARDNNLLAFTNEIPLTLQQFVGRMRELAYDPAALQRSVLENLFYARMFLIRRRRALVVTYGLFIAGLALSASLFALTLIRQSGSP